MYSGVVQDGHNDLKVFFQKGGQYQKNQKVPGDKNAAEQCAKLCAGTCCKASIQFCIVYMLQYI
jgi:hypothetical protein